MTPSPKLIFDFDGVIANSNKLHMDAWSHAHEKMFAQPLPTDINYLGKIGREIAKDLLRKNKGYGKKEDLSEGESKTALELYQLKSRQVAEQAPYCEIYHGFSYLAAKINHLNIPWAIASNARRQFIETILERNSISTPFISSIDDVERGKPHTEIFERIFNFFGWTEEDKGQIFHFDDSPVGIRPAAKLGINAVGITTTLSAEQLRQAGANFSLTGVVEIAIDGRIFG